MPTEVTPAPFRYSQQFPIALEHPRTWPAPQPTPIAASVPHQHQAPLAPQPSASHSNMAALGWSSVPPTGPARVLDCVPNKVLPNGVRNPWAPYAGAVYRPSAEKAENMAHGHLSAMGGAPNSFTYGDASTIAPPSLSMGMGMGGSLHPAHAAGARRIDEGWDGSSGRAHVGHMPDPTSTAGRLGRTPNAQSTNWMLAPSSFQNHARMTPSLAYDAPSAYLAPPVHPQSLQPRRASVSVPIGTACPTCVEGSGGLGRRASMSGSRDHQSRIANSPAVGSPLRYVKELPRDDEGLRRKVSSASRQSGHPRGRRGCNECSACD